MGTDYYLADPIAKEAVYIDRCGRDFSCDLDWEFEWKEVDGWLPGVRVRVLNPSRFKDLLLEEHCHRALPAAVAWCRGKKTVLLIDDADGPDSKSSNFCFRVCFDGGVQGWKATDLPRGWTGADLLAKL